MSDVLDLAQHLIQRLPPGCDRLCWPEAMQATIVQEALRARGWVVEQELQRCRVAGKLVYASVLTSHGECLSVRGGRGLAALRTELQDLHGTQDVEFVGLAQSDPFPEWGLEPAARIAFRHEIASDCACLEQLFLDAATTPSGVASKGPRL